jgi:hypothetical protein
MESKHVIVPEINVEPCIQIKIDIYSLLPEYLEFRFLIFTS